MEKADALKIFQDLVNIYKGTPAEHKVLAEAVAKLAE